MLFFGLLLAPVPAQSVLFELHAEGPSSAFGIVTRAVPDVDGDGREDIVYARRTGDDFLVELVSSSHQSVLQAIPVPRYDLDLLTLAGLKDVDGDGLGDFLISSNAASGAWVRAFSGGSGAILHEVRAINGSDHQANPVCDLADIDGDGMTDYLLGQDNRFTAGGYGTVSAHCGRTGQELWVVSAAPDVFGAIDWLQVFGDEADCNGNLRPDTCDVLFGSSLDVDLDGVPDECSCDHPGQVSCAANPNSTGYQAFLRAWGSASLYQNDFYLNLTRLPNHQPALLLMALTAQQVPFGDGWLCLANARSLSSGCALPPVGSWNVRVDLQAPLLQSAGPGTSIFFQAVYRDPGFGSFGWNTSEAWEQIYCP